MEINKETIKEYANRYDRRSKGTDDEIAANEITKWFKTHRYLDKERFMRVALWKSKRPQRHYASNDNAIVKEITQFSLATKNEEVRLKVLFAINGVSYPIASVILHFAFPDKYPILDFRVIWSLGIKQPKSYNFAFWQKYCDNVRDISKEMGESIRTVDKALWEYSKEHQTKEK
ncbi:hypothetical protein A3B05_00035 [Candidatus Giovannonibacteria bacterium RIFCSPLOWO2_01_FULL_43_160]|uniref:Uncharacterized protein n=1 Tax=Candidatus Giovannonibacteria bacterium GW2011_GWA2_44_26 TaxID=1618648 RepID=A0A0G1IXK9_9BACT|nr:MAG: hypothetical protein UV72_C0001G0062 [Candidatus Giovannonibacteria bacterium GW2011_GWB1_43_13]KKS99735.1 MAG: hypothetical protein UV75_C0002G0116 [Candidatus Giovannonibacteria bacterium GW2011_GWA1_43_15]KKT21855.1 MAG: hypothetical protein UW05_C0001G0002 [Candidatus Giovannonibacteria bacterium GW2011_GWC2_43_8]KKT63820.1 MAG: hypothetical protein UW55_C0001G0113 [Candidatus Giovannonibacteria bacterium GW2011_GWA2_44_26]OGF58879.1 MAG: hypothetical protein A2652_03425 [Candidatus